MNMQQSFKAQVESFRDSIHLQRFVTDPTNRNSKKVQINVLKQKYDIKIQKQAEK